MKNNKRGDKSNNRQREEEGSLPVSHCFIVSTQQKYEDPLLPPFSYLTIYLMPCSLTSRTLHNHQSIPQHMQHHAVPRSTTQHHASSRSITQHHTAPHITTQHHASPRSTTQHVQYTLHTHSSYHHSNTIELITPHLSRTT